ncbi:MAG: alpha/beta hydrolase [Myxococcales bacterium]|nr:alpha/beta hydrolase [Myxococcales bacterium]
MAFGFQIPVFEQIARELSKAGLAVLRYDKRTCGSFNGCAENGYPTPDPAITIQAFLDDALAAADWVKRQPNIDPNVVIIAGHSQGGQLVPHALRDRPWLAAGMLIAAPFRAIDATMAYQAEFTRTLLRENGMSEAQIDSTLSDLDSTVDALAQLRAGTYAGARISSASTAFWRSWMDLSDDTPGILESLDRPLFVISGGYDWNVPPSENDLWKSAFAALAIKPGHRNQIIDCVTHALNCVSQPDYKAIRPTDIGSEVSEEFLAVMRDFIKSDIGGKQR